jgi:type II secretory pathway pseudopilin PulG
MKRIALSIVGMTVLCSGVLTGSTVFASASQQMRQQQMMRQQRMLRQQQDMRRTRQQTQTRQQKQDATQATTRRNVDEQQRLKMQMLKDDRERSEGHADVLDYDDTPYFHYSY